MVKKAEAVSSPVLPAAGTKMVDEVRSHDIIHLYKKIMKVDVSRFFNGHGTIEVRECNSTGFRFYYPFNTAGDSRFYESMHLTGDYYRPWSYDHQLAYDTVQNNEQVLEIGCGSGLLLEKLKEKTNRLTGLEFHQTAVDECRKKGLDVINESIEQHAAKRPAYYDVVCIMQVLEHVTAVHSFLSAAVRVLKPGGKLIIGVPNCEPWFRRFDKYEILNMPPHHMGLWNEKVFRAIQDIFGIRLDRVLITDEARILVDAYLRAKCWLDIKTLIHHHSAVEKIKMAALGAVTVPLSIAKKLNGGIPGGYIGVVFSKN
jgi:2-polyprenyl-3-methyl-5-hydroxy-6-metoxy-1,4-benzoquinol methylase